MDKELERKAKQMIPLLRTNEQGPVADMIAALLAEVKRLQAYQDRIQEDAVRAAIDMRQRMEDKVR